MAFDSYTSLVTTIQRFADSSEDMTDIIRLAEIQAQLDLRLRMTETTVSGTLTAGQDFLLLPSDCVLPRHLRLDLSPVRNVDIVAQEVFDFWRQLAATVPQVGLNHGLKLYLAPTPADNYPYTLFYDAGIPALSVANPTNWLLQNVPNVLLYGSLLQLAQGFLGGDDRVAGWGERYTAAVKPARQREAFARFGGGPVSVKPDTWA